MISSTVCRLVATVALLCSLQLAQAAPGADELTFPQLRDGEFRAFGQWKIALATGNKASTTFTPVSCPNPELGACTATNPPLKQDSGDLLRITYSLNPGNSTTGGLNKIRTYKNMQPTVVQFRICYTLASSVDRAWRKKNKPYPRLSQNCPRTAATLTFNGTTDAPDVAANSGVVLWDMDMEDEIPTATWFVMAWVWCGDSQVCAFQSTEGRAAIPELVPKDPVYANAVPGNFFETAVEMGITPGMKAAAIILSIIGPTFFIAFYIADSLYYKKTGKAIRLF